MHIKLILIALYCSFILTGLAQQGISPDANRKPQYLIRSTLGSSGQSKILTTDKGIYLVSQSVGQASVIGTFYKNKYTIRQGFQQPLISAQIIELPENIKLRGTVYPNPFNLSVNVLFEELINDELSVKIYNLSGGILHDKIYPKAQSLSIPLDFLLSGNYLLKITTENKRLLSKIIKQ